MTDTGEADLLATVPDGLFLGDKWRAAETEATPSVRDPVTGTVVKEIVDASVADGRAVLDAACEAFRPRPRLIMLNEVALARVGDEVVTDIARRLRRESPLAATIVVSPANDRIGYLPDDAAYDRRTFAVTGSPVQQGHAEDGIVDGFVDMTTGGLR